MTHPGVGPVTAQATEVFLGAAARFADGKALASYAGMISSEHSGGGQQRTGKLSKQGNPLLRLLWVEPVRQAVRRDPRLKQFYWQKLVQTGRRSWLRPGSLVFGCATGSELYPSGGNPLV